MTTSHTHPPEDAPARSPSPKRQVWWREFAAFWAFGLREYRIWQSYRVNQVLWMTNILVTTLLFFLLGKTIAGQAASLLGPAYGTNYMSFVVIGVTVNVFINTNLSDPYIRIQRSYFNGTMDLFLLSPMSIYTPLLGLMTKSILDDYPRLYFTFGFGMLSASSFYLLDIKKGTEPIQFVIQQLLATLLAGTYYPVTVLPKPLQWLACLIPHTYANDALRRLLDPGAQASVPVLPIQQAFPGVSPVLIDGGALVLFTVILLPLGILAYGWGIERARRNGTLTRWQ